MQLDEAGYDCRRRRKNSRPERRTYFCVRQNRKAGVPVTPGNGTACRKGAYSVARLLNIMMRVNTILTMLQIVYLCRCMVENTLTSCYLSVLYACLYFSKLVNKLSCLCMLMWCLFFSTEWQYGPRSFYFWKVLQTLPHNLPENWHWCSL